MVQHHTGEREFSKPEGNSMNPTEAATDSCWSVCHSLRSMVCSLTVSIWTAHCTSTHQVSRRGCARQLLHVPLGRAPRALRAGTGQATHLPITRAPRLHPQWTSSKGKPHERGETPRGEICLRAAAHPNNAPPQCVSGRLGIICLCEVRRGGVREVREGSAE